MAAFRRWYKRKLERKWSRWNQGNIKMNKEMMSPDTQVISHQFNIEFGLSCAAIFQFEWCNGHQSWHLTRCQREIHSVDYKIWRYYKYEVQAPQ